jgi:hypothetical protein
MTLDWCDNVNIQANDGREGKYNVQQLGPLHMSDAHQREKLEEFYADEQNGRTKGCREKEVNG